MSIYFSKSSIFLLPFSKKDINESEAMTIIINLNINFKMIYMKLWKPLFKLGINMENRWHNSISKLMKRIIENMN